MLRRVKNLSKFYNSYRSVSCSTWHRKDNSSQDTSDDISSSVKTKFQVFRNESIGEILDIEEERAKLREKGELNVLDEQEEIDTDLTQSLYADLNLERKLNSFTK